MRVSDLFPTSGPGSYAWASRSSRCGAASARPALGSPERGFGPVAGERSNVTRPTILIVDDEENILDILGSVLHEEGYAVLRARDGAEGLRLAQEHRPALIIADIMMPLLTGIELIGRLKESEATASTPTILMSCVSRAPGPTGATVFLGKPFDLDDVLSLVKGYLPTIVPRGPARGDAT